MSEDRGRYDARYDRDEAGEALCDLLGVGNADQLALVLEEVIRRTGWGDVHLVIADGRVTHIKATVSVKLGGQRGN